MPSRALILVLALVGAACGRPGDPARAPAPAVTLATAGELARGEVEPGSYVVTFRGNALGAVKGFGSFASEARRHMELLARPAADTRVKDLRYITNVDLRDPKDPDRLVALDPPRALRLAFSAAGDSPLPATIAQAEFGSPEAAAATLADWERDGLIWFAEPNHLSRPAQQVLSGETVNTYTTMDVWWHKRIKLVEAFNLITQRGITPGNPIVAVLDSGVDAENTWLKPQIWQNPAHGVVGCGEDVYGCNATEATKDTYGNGNVYPYTTKNHGEACPGTTSQDKSDRSKAESCGHGTHVAGIVAAVADGSGDTAIGGVCPVCRIMIVKIIKDGVAADTSILNAFKYLTQFKQSQTDSLVRVANASIGTYNRSRAIALLISVLYRAPNNVLLVGAAGNEDSMIRSYPAGYAEALAVAATGQDDAKAIYSNFGSWIGISAPGGDAATGAQIYSTVPGVQGRDKKQGTSMASPVVAGVAGLVISVDPGRSAAALRDSLIRSADPRLYAAGFNGTSYDPEFPDEGKTPLLGSGVVDAEGAVANDRITGYTLDGNDTVQRGCGTLPGEPPPPPLALVLLALAPVLAAAGSAARAQRLDRVDVAA